ncbi:MAG: hypothetical protein WD066_13005 [Planctomycetaceae bacterium]
MAFGTTIAFVVLAGDVLVSCRAADRAAAPIVVERDPHQSVDAPHAHPPVEVFGDPIVTRLPVPARDPRRVVIDSAQRVLIADAAAGKVLRVSSSGMVETLAADLDEPAGLALDSQGRLYAAIRAGGRPRAGSVIRIDAADSTTTVLDGLSAPTAIAFDADDVLHVAVAGDESILRVASPGGPTVVARGIESPSALAHHRGAWHVASATKGTITRIDADGRATIVAEGFMSLSDLAIGPEGELIACDEADTLLAAVGPDGQRKPFLPVPAGTRAIAFDGDGNLVAASGQLRIVVRLTTRLSVPCPHCDQRIPLRIRPRRPQPDTEPDPI